MDRDTALAEFDSARDSFLAALGEAPDESLTYLPSGDIYAIGGLAVHCNRVLKHYRRALDGLGSTTGELRVVDPDGETAEADRRALAGLAPAERSGEMAELQRLHEGIKSAARALPAGTWEVKRPVIFGDAAEAYPTSPDDVVGWLRDHYREHIPHAGELLAAWRASRVAT